MISFRKFENKVFSLIPGVLNIFNISFIVFCSCDVKLKKKKTFLSHILLKKIYRKQLALI